MFRGDGATPDGSVKDMGALLNGGCPGFAAMGALLNGGCPGFAAMGALLNGGCPGLAPSTIGGVLAANDCGGCGWAPKFILGIALAGPGGLGG